MKRFFVTWLIVGISIVCSAQIKPVPDSLRQVIQNASLAGENRVLACVKLGQYYIKKTGEYEKDIDSAANALKDAKELTLANGLKSVYGELLFLEALINKEKGQRTDAARLDNLALIELRKKPRSYFLGCALTEKGDLLNIEDQKQLLEKITLYKEAVTCFDSVRNAKARAGTLKMLGDLYSLHQQNPKNIAPAIQCYQRALDTYFNCGYRNVQDIYIEIAKIYRTFGDNDQGLRYCLLAVRTAEKAGDVNPTLCEIYNYTGVQYLVLGDYVNAKKYLEQSLVLAEKFHDRNGIFIIGNNLYSTYSRSNKYNKIKPLIDRIHAQFPESDLHNQYLTHTLYLRYYTAVKDSINGKRYCIQLVNLLKAANPAMLKITGLDSYNAISNYYAMVHEYSNAYKYWERAYVAASQSNNPSEDKIQEIYQHFRLDSLSHNLPSAISYLDHYTRLRDSLYSATKDAKEANLKIFYDTKEKEFELTSSKQKIVILTKNERLQQANLNQFSLMRKITVISTLILIVIGVMLYRAVVHNKKAARKIEKSNALLEKVVSEKEWLLREIHHRVKNNLHTIICLLESQSAYLEKDALTAVEDSRHRIYVMSLIHQKLYENADMKMIDMSDFITSLVNYLQDCFDLKSDITFRLDIAPVLIDTSIAIPIGLIINEAITNSIKHGFPGNHRGRITIQLCESEGKLIVIIADNGIGIDEGKIGLETRSMGLRLMYGLAGDVGGKITIKNDNGTKISLTCNRVLAEDEQVDVEKLLNNIPNQNAG